MSRTIATDGRQLSDAFGYLTDRGLLGFVWLDPDLVVQERVGNLVSFVPIGKSAGTAIVPLYGCEDDIRRLRHDAHHTFELANIRIMGAGGEGPRLNFSGYWLETSQRFLLVVVPNTPQSEVAAELENQSRRRALAEARYIEKSKAFETANAELTRANRELEEFASIISHDLKSPMRTMRYITEDIEQSLQNGNHDAAMALLRDLKQQARRMSGMLSDLLAYARIGPTDDGHVTEFETRDLIESIVASLPRPAGFTVERTGAWPTLRGVRPALDLIVRNLVDNAIKHHDRPDGRVILTAEPVRGGLEIVVVDDGPGIDPRYHKAIFQPFRRIETTPAQDDRSTGIGLSLVRKTVETNGATLSLESAPTLKRGTTFRLRWPGEIVTK